MVGSTPVYGERFAKSSYEYPICSSVIFDCLLCFGISTRSFLGLLSNNQDKRTLNSGDIFVKVAIAEVVCPFLILYNKLLEILHSSSICYYVFFVWYLSLLIFILI